MAIMPEDTLFLVKFIFKREKDLDLEWPDNVVPFPRASEERYFAGGKKL